MSKLLTGLFLGIALGLVVAWCWTANQETDEVGDQHTGKEPRLKDINWFPKVEGFPELIFKAPKLADTLKDPDKVTVYRIVDEGGEILVRNYSLGQPHAAVKEQVDNYSRVFCSPTSVTDVSMCVFSPGFAIRFQRNKSDFYALVCYSCSDILIYDAHGEQVGGFGMTREAEAALAVMFRETFPDDSEVQDLKF
jgi:hypothetical protein